jgi:hypothetical protein
MLDRESVSPLVRMVPRASSTARSFVYPWRVVPRSGRSMPNAMERPDRGEWSVLPETERRLGKTAVASKICAVNSAANAFWMVVAAPKMFAPKRRTQNGEI